MEQEAYPASIINDIDKLELKARQALHNLNMRGGFVSAKVRNKLESQAGIGGAVDQIISGPKISRNETCPCASGKKYKKCCGVLT